HWASYGLGAYTVLMAEHVVGSFPCGATIVVHSNVPLGAGVSSSAALEVAVMKALSHSYGFPMAGIPLASLCQKV
ncbi:MAG TPA: GHMP kinase, partial [Candidatus Latescibacteria bacterium]|nr:GHMP kinase [Candidatus Latescibacterota bacterium]